MACVLDGEIVEWAGLAKIYVQMGLEREGDMVCAVLHCIRALGETTFCPSSSSCVAGIERRAYSWREWFVFWKKLGEGAIAKTVNCRVNTDETRPR